MFHCTPRVNRYLCKIVTIYKDHTFLFIVGATGTKKKGARAAPCPLKAAAVRGDAYALFPASTAAPATWAPTGTPAGAEPGATSNSG